MKYWALKSVVGSQKQLVQMNTASPSFYQVVERPTPYIEPTFTKEEHPKEKPAILLVSAVGASGKTTTARALGFDTGLPLLDLAAHKPVADNSLTGILTSAYPIEKVGAVLEGLRNGTHGIIIDGVDEGRSKTTEHGFEAFLDDVIERSEGAAGTSVVIFGRGQTLFSTWYYLAEKNADVALVRIDPFSLEQAKEYIDAYVTHKNASQKAMYEEARDAVLSKLGAAFASSDGSNEAFLSFIGYPPVLDAIATLLSNESNYHRIKQALSDGANAGLEVTLLIQIATYLLQRERNEKAVPNFITEISSKADAQTAQKLQDALYNEVEQSARVLSRALGRTFPRRLVDDAALNEEYEKAIGMWCPEHPFLNDMRIRNAVFEAIVVSHCVLSDIPEYSALAVEYTASRRPTYHLLYIMADRAANAELDCRHFNMLIQACSDFMGKGNDVAVEVSGLSWDEPDLPAQSTAELEVAVAVQGTTIRQVFKFKGRVSNEDHIPFGPFLANAAVTLPCEIALQGAPTLECGGTCRIVARKVYIDTPDLLVRQIPGQAGGDHVGLFLDVAQAQGHAQEVAIKGGTIEIACLEHDLAYPLAKYVQKTERTIPDDEVAAKYRRLRRILSEFASHSKGGLAKYRDKIEHERVLRGKMGEQILARLLQEGVLSSDPKFYYVDSDKLSKVLGTTWHDLRQYKMSKSVEAFLKRVS